VRDSSPYRVLPAYYDTFMSHVDYLTWGQFLRRVWRRQGLNPGDILELGAGTCPFHRTQPFPPQAEVIYTDLSAAMLAAADRSDHATGKKKPGPKHRAACNAISLPFRSRSFDLILMVYDAFNYLMDEKGVLACLQEVKRVLRPGGLFIFDVTTLTNSQRHFQDLLEVEELPDATLIRRSHFDETSSLQETAFTVFLEDPDHRYRKEEEIHQQRVFPLAQIQMWADKAGLARKGCFAGFSFKPGTESSERVHFVLST